MNAEEFVAAIKMVVLDAAVRGVESSLLSPPGRQPAEGLVRASEWYLGLPDDSRSMVMDVARDAAHAAVFGLLAVLDGVRAIEGYGPKGSLRLAYVSPSGEESVLNDEAGEELHDLLNSIAMPYGNG